MLQLTSYITFIFIKPFLRIIILCINILVTQSITLSFYLLKFWNRYIKIFEKNIHGIIFSNKKRGGGFIWKIEVDITTDYSLNSTKNIRNFQIWSLILLKYSKNQNFNKCTI